ncbi:DNA methyltransferase [Desulforudis sp. 1031]
MSALFNLEPKSAPSGPVECLGTTFPNDEERRKYFLEKLREKLQDPEFRRIEGFPIGSDEDILALSDPPYYTACPNPFIEDFIRHYGKPYDPANDNYRREPFAADVSEGKNDPIYNAHSYHTKVPHKAIMRYILHYTEPGDVVFDGFCGTGMTGVAAQLCGDRKAVESLGYKVDKDGTISQQETDENGRTGWKPFSKLGARRVVLNDLSPAATFIAYNYNTPVDVKAFEREAKRILKEVEDECGWMYETLHTDGKTKGRINYTVWSEVFACPDCGAEIVYYDAAFQQETFEVADTFPCPHCRSELNKKSLLRMWDTYFDESLKKSHRLVRYRPVLINYQVGGNRYKKKPDEYDLLVLKRIEEEPVTDWFPTHEMPDGERKGKDGYHLKGITHLPHFYFRRALVVYARMWQKVNECATVFMRFFVQGNGLTVTKMNRYRENAFSQVNQYMSGTMFVGSLISEVSPAYSMTNKLQRLSKLQMPGITEWAAITTQSTTSISTIADNSIDYIFVDPPFGNNLHYSELNFFWEAWLKVLTQREPEAVMDKERNRTLQDYQQLMTKCFQEICRVLKPGRWLTVEFHNSRNSVWFAIQQALEHAGFVVADVRTLDKQQETYKQSIQKLVKQDLVITAYKPNGGLEQRFRLVAGTEEGAWDFTRTHLKQLPVFVSKDGKAEVIAERQNYLLFDRMVAFHVQRGVTVPLSAAEFYAGLAQRFPECDGMYFLPEQVAEYDKKRMKVKEVLQLQLFVTDEASAIQWLKQQLTRKPQTFQELHPQFLKEIGGWQKHEKPLELSELLEQNFLRYDGKGPIPAQIVSWMKQSADLRKIIQEEITSGHATEDNGQLSTQSSVLIARAKDRWYVPDPNKAGDLEKLRERALLREFEEYRTSSQKRLRVFRLEAVRAGFKKAWQERDYATIVAVARKIPENVLQEDPKLLMWYDQALTRIGDNQF